MTSLLSQVDPELLVLLVFWAVVVVALLLSTAANEVRGVSDHFAGERRDDSTQTLPSHHPQMWPSGTHRLSRLRHKPGHLH